MAGEGRQRRPAWVRAQALEAAVDEFSERGFEAGSLRRIAKRAGISQPLLSYHFRSKAELWAAAKAEVVKRARERLSVELQREASTADRVEGAMRAFFHHARAEPRARRIGMWAELGGDAVFEGEPEMVGTVLTLVRQAQDAGQLRGDVDAGYLIWIFRSAVYDYLANRNRVCALFGWDPDDPEVDERFLLALRQMSRRPW